MRPSRSPSLSWPPRFAPLTPGRGAETAGFDLRGHTVLSYDEFIELTRTMKPHAETPPALVAWFGGERLSPQTLQTTFERCAPHVVDERGHELLSIAVRRLHAALGRDEFDLSPLPPAEPGEL